MKNILFLLCACTCFWLTGCDAGSEAHASDQNSSTSKVAETAPEKAKNSNSLQWVTDITNEILNLSLIETYRTLSAGEGDCEYFILKESYNKGWTRFLSSTDCGEYGADIFTYWYRDNQLVFTESQQTNVDLTQENPQTNIIQERLYFQANAPAYYQTKVWDMEQDPESTPFETKRPDKAPEVLQLPFDTLEYSFNQLPGADLNRPFKVGTIIDYGQVRLLELFTIKKEPETTFVYLAKGEETASGVDTEALSKQVKSLENKLATIEIEWVEDENMYEMPFLAKITPQ